MSSRITFSNEAPEGESPAVFGGAHAIDAGVLLKY
jgi:hypothetical protein